MSLTLPSQRELLTTLVRTLCAKRHDGCGSAASATTRPAAERHSSPDVGPWDSPQRKKLILTLHAVFPGMLLPALDLLDRNLVRRVTLDPPTPPSRDRRQAGFCSPTTRPERGRGGEPAAVTDHAVYTVRSAASTLPRWGTSGATSAAATTHVYLVHLEAWSCSCAGFAVDAYAVAAAVVGRGDDATDVDDDGASRMGKFGGRGATQLDVQGMETTPCCKHLLACLLVEEWEELLAAHVQVENCTIEEMAGIIAGV
ncbi:hypothetical protein V2A60_008985 [Cordyceps javanica]|uniref:SWIM-type domain-containing protein n=1 Tax=Cordyceps javanica TaxID=43265 RepID=A0A545VNB4_9HYPO|nr:hypothetical protein IF1G_09864 [Cordyceps javanica]TQW03220.1 hypothetical protein IF2G_09353 [Cordyceps javanica]